jgi:tight adherence protein B
VITLILIVVCVAVASSILAGLLTHYGSNMLARGREFLVRRADVLLREMFIFTDANRLYLLVVACTVLALLGGYFYTDTLVAGLGIACAAAVLPLAIVRWLQRRRRNELERQMPEALIMLAGGLRAGASLAGALRELAKEMPAPLGAEFTLALREQRLGVPLDTALDHLAQRLDQDCSSLAVAAMRIAHESGGGLAEALERVAATLRAQFALQAKIKALTAQGRLQAVIVGLLPLALFAALHRMEPDEMGLLFTTRVGWATLCAIVVLEFSGLLLLRRIVRIDV